MSNARLLEARDVGLRFGTFTALESFFLTVPEGACIGIVGESGSGKSTAVKVMAGLLSPDQGVVLYEGHDVRAMSKAEFEHYRRSVQIVSQDYASALNPRRSIGEQLTAPILRFRLRPTLASATERAAELLNWVGLQPQMLDRYPHELSGGQQQRVCIARALCVEPSLLIMDEPMSALDVSVRLQVIHLLSNLRRQLGVTYVLTAHNLEAISILSDTVLVMENGRVVESGTNSDVFLNPQHPFTRRLMDAMLL